MTSEHRADSRTVLGPWFALFTLAAVAVAIGLGVWQVQRLTWKETLIADLEARSTATAAELPKGAWIAEAMLYRPYRLAGTLHPELSLNLLSRPRANQQGRHLVAPLVLMDGRVVLLDRGWVPLDWTAPQAPEPRSVEIEALARTGGWQGSEWLKPANDPAGNAWLWLDLPAMAEAVGLPGVETGLYFSARADQEPGRYPVGGQTQVNLRNDHLEYAITWFALAFAVSVTYILLRRRSLRDIERR